MLHTQTPRIKLSDARHRPISVEVERILIHRAAAGDRAARDRLVNANLKFVVLVAQKFRGCGLPEADLINEGAIGLVTAATRFDPENPVRFISYAVWWIRQAMLMALQEQSSVIRTPAISNLKWKLKEAERRSEYSPPAAEEAERLRERIEEITNIRELKSVDTMQEVGQDLPDLSKRTDASAETWDRHRTTERALEILCPLDQMILRRYYGLAGGSPETLEQIAQRLNITREGVRKRREKAIIRIKRKFEINFI